MIRLSDVSIGRNAPDEINVLVTAPAGSAPMLMDEDPVSGVLTVMRLYQTAMRLPGTLGLIPQTRGEAGRTLGAFLPLDDPIPAGLVVPCRPVGVVYVSGADAQSDTETVVAIPLGRVTARLERVRSYTDIPAPSLRQFSHFLTHCQDLEDDQVMRSVAWGDVNEARRAIVEARARVQPPATVSN